MSAPPRSTVAVWFDPSCPYTWVTARWLREVERVRPVVLDWHLMSLTLLNEGRDDDPEGDPEGWLMLPVRLFAVVRERYGVPAMLALYDVYGRLVHEAGTWVAFEEVLAAAGLPVELAAAAHDESVDPLVRASHEAGVALVGPHVGTPIVAADGVAWFGPVLSRVPAGEEAGRLWDGVVQVAAVEGFHELKGRPHQPPRYDRP